LRQYFLRINEISDTPFNVDSVATLELEWWIIRRDRKEHPPTEWETFLAATAHAMYHVPTEKFSEYAHLRTEAMLIRDAKGENVTEKDWMEIDSILQRAWSSFAQALK
jgi:hypothetical protein